MIGNGLFQRREERQGQIVGRSAGERVKESTASTKGREGRGGSIKGLTVTQAADYGGRGSCVKAAESRTASKKPAAIQTASGRDAVFSLPGQRR